MTMTRLNAFVLTTLALSTPAARATAAEPAAPPPELAKTVAAFNGKTVYDSTITLPGGKPVKAKLTIDCKKTALGKGVACQLSGNIPGIGPYEGAILVGYDTHGKAVHFMAITSDEEVHDHVCHWKGDELPCAPLKGGMGGQPVVEELSFSFVGKQRAFSSTITFADGGKATFEAMAKR
jgi:hypothetical protein